MTNRLSSHRVAMLASALGLLIAAGPAIAQAPPGFSPLDKTKPAESKQDQKLRPHPTPPIATAADKLPVDKIKLPAGFKAEVWSHGHPGGRTMVMGDKGTMFMGTRLIGRVYAITDKDGKREVKTLLSGPDAAERARLQGRLALRVRHQQGAALRQHRGQARQSRRSGRSDQGLQSARHRSTTTGNTSRSGPTARCTCRSAPTATSARSIPASTARSAATISTAPAWKSWRAACATRSASTGIRSPRNLWFTDNGRDWAGNDGPQDELEPRCQRPGGRQLRLPVLPRQRHRRSRRQAAQSLRRRRHAGGAAWAARRCLGIKFYTGKMFPATYQNVAFIARRGSWNRDKKFGYDVAASRSIADGNGQDRTVHDRLAR